MVINILATIYVLFVFYIFAFSIWTHWMKRRITHVILEPWRNAIEDNCSESEQQYWKSEADRAISDFTLSPANAFLWPRTIWRRYGTEVNGGLIK